MKHLRPFNALGIMALLLAGLTAPTFGQGPSTQGESPTVVETAVIPFWAASSQHPLASTPEPPPTKELPPVSLGTAPVEPADAGVKGDRGIMATWPGPDGYGYVGQTVSYNWVEISGSGTAVYLSDDVWDGPFSIGFTFNFYGTDWTDFYINSNGFISFGGGSADYDKDCPLPNVNTPDDIIALMWDDLDPGDYNDPVYYQSFGTCPIGSGACLVVQYENYRHFPGHEGDIAGTFEAVLFDNGEIVIQFKDAGPEGGSGSTTGIEDSAAASDYGLTYACDTAGSLSDDLAIRFGFPTGFYLSPSELEVTGCAGLSQNHTFALMNYTGAVGIFDLSYDVPSGNGTLTGPPSLTLNDSERRTFDVELTPEECLPEGTKVIATIEASGNGYDDTSVITRTITAPASSWEFRTSLPTARGDLAVVASGDSLYAIGGAVSGFTSNGENERYDIPGDDWAAVASMPTPLTIIDGGEIDGIIYIPGGYDGANTVDTHQAYATATDNWSTVAAAPRAVVAYAVATCGGRLYRSGGAEFATRNGTTGLEVYNPVADTWTPLASMNHGHTWHAMECINGKLYVAGGFDETGSYTTVAEVYDIAAGTWSDAAMADLPETWLGAADFRKHDMLYLAGGIVSGVPSADVIIYDPATDSWEYGPPLQDARFRLEGDFAVDSGYAIGGRYPLWMMHDSNEYLVQCPECTEQGWLEGHVMDSELGDTEPPCTDAVVRGEPGDLDISVDPATGYYGPMQLISGTYTLEASADGFSEETVVVDITTSMTTTQDFSLERPVIAVEPTDFSVTVPISQEKTYSLTISNNGHLPLDFEIRELLPTLSLDVLSGPRSNPGIETEPELLAQLNADETTGYMIYFREQPDLSTAFKMDWHERGWFVVNALRETAERSQAKVRAYLDARGADYQPFWIDNVIVVNSSDRNTFDSLMNFSEVAALRARRVMRVIEPVEKGPVLSLTKGGPGAPGPMVVESNISHVGADQVWELGFTGEDLVVANIDTGVRYTHNALANQYRGNLGGGSYDHDYNWLGAAGGSNTPLDDHGHGSHTMGTMIGDDGGTNQIGMAPGARWIACDGCEGTGCPDAALLTCAQWVAAPYPIGNPGSPNPDMRPHVVNNSWGDCSRIYDNWYQVVVDSWHAAGIYPIFSNGNNTNCFYPEPPGCNTVGNPARYGNVTGVGSTGQSDGQYATHSNWGPTDNPDTVNPRGYSNLKPQVLAPGVNIRSSLSGSDSAYDSWGGTSMSAPHVAGLIALMWQAAPCLVGDYATTETLIEQTATPIPYASGCGGEGPGNVPNHATGWGEINALAAVQAAQDYCGADWLPWVWEDPITGTIPGPEEVDIDVTFYCTETHDYTGTLRIFHNDPCEDLVDVPIMLHCQEEPGFEWDKWVGDIEWYPKISVTLETSDTIEVVDRVWTYTDGVTFTLVEAWTGSLELTDWVSDAGSVMTSTNTLTWDVTNAAINTWYAITKTFRVKEDEWLYGYITETLEVENAVLQPDDRVLTLVRGSTPGGVYLPIIMKDTTP